MVVKSKKKPKKKQIKQSQKQNQYVNQIVKIYLDERKTKRRATIPKKKIPTIIYQNPLSNMYPLQQPYNPFFYPRQPVRNTAPPQTTPPQSQTTQQNAPLVTTSQQTAPFTQPTQTQTDNFPDLQSNNPLSVETQDNPLEELYNRYIGEPREEQKEEQKEAEEIDFPSSKEDIKLIELYNAMKKDRKGRGRKPKTREGYEQAINRWIKEEQKEATEFNKTI